LKTPVYINSIASVSPLGRNSEEIWQNYKSQKHFIRKYGFSGTEAFAAYLPKELKEEINEIRSSSPGLRNLDESVLFSVYVAREAVKKAGWGKGENIGVNIGSSRGATQLFEKYHKSFLDSNKAEILASPTTTLGNISSWVAQDLQSKGPEISHSVTCSTGLHAVLNGVAWLQAEMADKFVVGGSEAALTPFTIAQMKAMKIYASEDLEYPCRALDMEKMRNSMVLGEGAGVLCLSKSPEKSIAKIEGIGYATEKLKHSVSISANGECFQKSMKMAIGNKNLDEIDIVVMHAPGTIKGDKAEVTAIRELFGDKLPAMTSNKWKIGHTFGASGILSMELAILMLEHQEFISVPYSKISKATGKIRNILVNAVGFGGNAVSILVSKA
jgi:3-oxoacyl-(acyl-carrier-protein) synthase